MAANRKSVALTAMMAVAHRVITLVRCKEERLMGKVGHLTSCWFLSAVTIPKSRLYCARPGAAVTNFGVFAKKTN